MARARRLAVLAVPAIAVLLAGGFVALAPQAAGAAGTVTITTPSNGATVFGNPTFTAVVGDPSDVVCVTFAEQDGTKVAYSCQPSGPGTYSATEEFTDAGVQTVTATAQTTSGVDETSAPVTVIVDPGAYHPLTPQRVLDTRTDGSGGVAGRSTTTFNAGTAGVPTTASAVVFNLTETGATGTGFVTAYGAGTNRPTASNLNYVTGQTVANLVTVAAAYGQVTLYNGGTQTVQMVADVVGYYETGTASTPTSAGHFQALAPCRVLDTRIGLGRSGTAPVPAQGVVPLTVAGQCGLPAQGAVGVAFTLTETQATSVGNLRAYPQSAGSTETSAVNFVPGQDAANLVILPLDASGIVDLLNSSAGTTHIVADVVGYDTAAPASASGSGLLTAIAPTRILDTRYGTGAPQGELAAGGTLTLPVGSALGVPANAVGAAVLNVTVTDTTALGYLTVYPAGQPRPTASTLNFGAGGTAAALTLAELGDAGAVTIYNSSAHPVDVVVDAAGFYSP